MLASAGRRQPNPVAALELRGAARPLLMRVCRRMPPLLSTMDAIRHGHSSPAPPRPRSPVSRLWFPLATLALLAVAGCGRSPGGKHFPQAPVVIVSIDTLRADHLPAYGYAAGATPHLDRLRRDSILFENAYSHVPLTLPAHVSLFTGTLPFVHGVRDNLGYRLDAKSHPTLAGLLAAKGYATGAAVSAHVLRADTGVGAGFAFYEDRIEAPLGADALGRVQRSGQETLVRLEPWLAGVRDRPFFLFLHLYEPHAPYAPPEAFRGRHPLPYDGEVAAADAVVGRLLDEMRRLGVYDRSIVVVLSDHGEGLGEHGEDEHGILLYRWALHVPLFLKLPGGDSAGATMSEPTGLVDLVPTLAGLLGLTVPERLPGRSVFEGGERGRIYAETYYPRLHLGWSELRSLVDRRWQYIEGRRRELYDIGADPRQQHDVLASQRETGRSRQKELAGLPAGLVQPADVGPEEREKLAALGYLGGAAEATGPLPDPRESLPALNDVKAAFRLAAAGRNEEAVALFRAVLARFPSFFDARYELAQTLTRLGRHDEAYAEFRAAIRSSPGLAASVALPLARVCLRLGRHDEAVAHARIANRANPAAAHELLARVALARDDLATAEAEAAAATGDVGAELGAAVVRTEVRVRQGRLPEALDLIEAARRRVRDGGLQPVPDLDFLRGDVLARLGRLAEAQRAFEAEVGAFPANSKAWARLAILYGLQRRTVREVDALLERMVAANPQPETLELAAKTLESMGDPRGAAAWRGRKRR
jgi:choline-sulfatase